MSDPRQTDSSSSTVNRREMMLGVGAVGAGLLAATLAADSARADSHNSHGGHGQGPQVAPHQALIESALACVKDGAICLDECIVLLGTGNPSMKECIRSVSNMLPACDALARLAALNSAHLQKMAAVCVDICVDCERECKAHADKHWQCRRCMESCQHCIMVCNKLLGRA